MVHIQSSILLGSSVFTGQPNIAPSVGARFSTAGMGHASSKPIKILMVGPSFAGKTTIMYKLKLGKVNHTIPTIGLNILTMEFKHASFVAMDSCSQMFFTNTGRLCRKGMDAVIYVIGSSDVEDMDSARDALHRLLNEEELRHVPLLVLANKQDLPRALSPYEVAERLGLPDFPRRWSIHGTCATLGDGLCAGLDWLSSTFSDSHSSGHSHRQGGGGGGDALKIADALLHLRAPQTPQEAARQRAERLVVVCGQIGPGDSMDPVIELVEQGVELQHENTAERVALVASGTGHTELLAYLLEAKAAAEPREIQTKLKLDTLLPTDTQILTPLATAAKRGHTEAIELLLRHGASVNAGLQRSNWGYLLPLHAALSSHQQHDPMPAVELLLDRQASVANTPFQSPLEQATQYGANNRSCTPEMVRLLLAHRADVHWWHPGGNTSTALHQAASWGRVSICRLLLEHKADVHARREGGGRLKPSALQYLMSDMPGAQHWEVLNQMDAPATRQAASALLDHGLDQSGDDWTNPPYDFVRERNERNLHRFEILAMMLGWPDRVAFFTFLCACSRLRGNISSATGSPIRSFVLSPLYDGNLLGLLQGFLLHPTCHLHIPG